MGLSPCGLAHKLCMAHMQSMAQRNVGSAAGLEELAPFAWRAEDGLTAACRAWRACSAGAWLSQPRGVEHYELCVAEYAALKCIAVRSRAPGVVA